MVPGYDPVIQPTTIEFPEKSSTTIFGYGPGNDKKGGYGLSFTRSAARATWWGVMLVFDQEKISHNYKLIPFHHAARIRGNPYGSNWKEAEEFLPMPAFSFLPIDKYLTGIWLNVDIETSTEFGPKKRPQKFFKAVEFLRAHPLYKGTYSGDAKSSTTPRFSPK